MRHRVREWLNAAQKKVQILEAQRAEVRKRVAALDARVEQVSARVPTALTELVEAVLPELSPEAIEHAVRGTGYTTLAQHDPIAAREAERARLLARDAEIEEEPSYVDRVKLRDPETGLLSMELAEREKDRQPLTGFVKRAAHPRLQRLLDVSYGQPTYDVGWWRLSYYEDWKAGDEVLEQLGEEYATFAAFRKVYLEISEAKGTFDAEVARLEREIAAGGALEDELAQNRARLQDLERIFLDQAREGLRVFVEDAGPPVLGERLSKVPEIETLAKRWAGLREKVRYLGELRTRRLEELDSRLYHDLAKTQRKMIKYRRPKHWNTTFSDADFHRSFRDRSSKYRKYWKKYDRVFETVSTFDRFDRGSLTGDVLWWDVMTDGRANGRFIPEVAQFYDENPGYSYVRPQDEDDAFAVAAGAIADADGIEPAGGLYDPS